MTKQWSLYFVKFNLGKYKLPEAGLKRISRFTTSRSFPSRACKVQSRCIIIARLFTRVGLGCQLIILVDRPDTLDRFWIYRATWHGCVQMFYARMF